MKNDDEYKSLMKEDEDSYDGRKARADDSVLLKAAKASPEETIRKHFADVKVEKSWRQAVKANEWVPSVALQKNIDLVIDAPRLQQGLDELSAALNASTIEFKNPPPPVIEPIKAFALMLYLSVPRTKIKDTKRCVYLSDIVTGDESVEHVARSQARAVNRLHEVFGVTGFLAECSTVQLFSFQGNPKRVAVFTFVQLQTDVSIDKVNAIIGDTGALARREGEIDS